MKTKQNYGFTLIELMIVVAIIAILAALAISSYQNYKIRSAVAGDLTQAFAWQKQLGADDAGSPGAVYVVSLPQVVTATGRNAGLSMVNNNGVIVITPETSGNVAALAGMTSITLTPAKSASGPITWACSVSGLSSSGQKPAGCN